MIACEIVLAVSGDHGATWSTRRITPIDDGVAGVRPKLAIADDGRIYVVYRTQGFGVSGTAGLRLAVVEGANVNIKGMDTAVPAMGESYDVAAVGNRVCIVYPRDGAVRLSTWVMGVEAANLALSSTGKAAFNAKVVSDGSTFLAAWEQVTNRRKPPDAAELTTANALPTRDVWSSFIDASGTVTGPFNRGQSADTDSQLPELAAFNGAFCIGWLEGNQESSPELELKVAATGPPAGTVTGTFAPGTIVGYVPSDALGVADPVSISGAGDVARVAWTRTADGGLGTEVVMAESSDSGRSFGTPVVVSGSGIDAYNPGIATIGEAWSAVWVSGASWYMMSDVQGSVFARSGGFEHDIAVTGLEVVQAPFGVTSLARNKNSKLRATIFNGNATEQAVHVHGEIRAKKDDADLVWQWDEDHTLPAAASTSIYLPEGVPQRLIGEDVMGSVTVTPVNAAANVDTSNDATQTARLPLVWTRGLKLGYFYLQLLGDHARTSTQLQAWADSSTKLVEGMLPLDETETSARVIASPITAATLGTGGGFAELPTADCTELTTTQVDAVYGDMNRAAALSDLDMVYGVVDDTFFPSRMKDITLGLAPWCPPPDARQPSALLAWSQAGRGPVVHETLHTYGWVTGVYNGSGLSSLVPTESYESHTALRAPGYWPEAGQEFPASARDLMYPQYDSTKPYWISSVSWDYMIDMLDTGKVDPPVVVVSGSIDASDTVTLSPWYRVDSVIDVGLDEPGDITIEYRDGLGTPIAQTGFTPSFHMAGADTATTTLARFTLRVPDVPGTASIAIKKGAVVLAERTASPSNPAATVTTPSAGATLTVGETATVSWTTADADADPLLSTVQLSTDNGTTWSPLALETTATSLEFVPTKAQVTGSALIKVLVTDGFNTGQDVTDAVFSIRPKEVPRTLYGEPVLQPAISGFGHYSGVEAMTQMVVTGSKVYKLRWFEGHQVGSEYVYAVGYVDESTDGGATFTEHPVPADSSQLVNAYSDILAFNASGDDVFIVYLDRDITAAPVRMIVSHDGGATWGASFAAYPNKQCSFRKLLVSGQDVVMCYTSTKGGSITDYAQVVVSHDGGRTFAAPLDVDSEPYSFYDNYWGDATLEGERLNLVVCDMAPDNSTNPPHYAPSGLKVYTSLDAGDSFIPTPATLDTEDDIRWPQMVADGDNVHITYEASWAPTEDLKIVTSHDGGLTLQAPITLSDVARPNNQAHLAADGGTVAILWDGEDRSDPDKGVGRVFIRTSADGGVTFSSTADITHQYAIDNRVPVTTASKGVAVSGNNVYGLWNGTFGERWGSNYIEHSILRVSTDYGATWHDPRDLCDGSPTNEARHGAPWTRAGGNFVAVGPDVYYYHSASDRYAEPDWMGGLMDFRRGIGAPGGLGVDAGEDQAVDEGGFAGIAASYSGASLAATPTATINWGDGTITDSEVTPIGSDGTIAGSHPYTEVGTFTVTVTLRDAADQGGSDTAKVVVGNLAPTVSTDIANPPEPIAGQRFELFGVPFADAGAGEPYTATVHWGDSGSSLGTVTVSADEGFAGGTIGTVDASHVYAAAGTYVARVVVSDGDASGEATISIEVTANAAPTADAGGPYDALEGTQVSLDASASTDPDDADLMYRWHVADRVIGGLGNISPFASATFADDFDTDITLEVSDGKGGGDSDTAPLTVRNAKPYYFDVADKSVSIQRGASIEATAEFMDAGRLDTHTASFGWGDGSSSAGSVVETQGAGVASGRHAYATAGRTSSPRRSPTTTEAAARRRSR